jgi:hypothetical protein
LSHGLRPNAPKLLPLQYKVREQNGKDIAYPDHRFNGCRAKPFPAGDTEDHTHFRKYQRNREAAGHPLPVLLNISLKNECERNRACEHSEA